MKIYGVLRGNDFEGGFLRHTLFKLRTDAIMEASAIANNQDYYEYIFNGVDEWSDGSDYIKVIECELI